MPGNFVRGAALLLGLGLLTIAPTFAGPGPVTVLLAPGPFPVTNPLKGFLPYAPDEDPAGSPSPVWKNNLTPSLEWFYLPLNAVVVDQGRYDWTALERRLDAVAQRGHQSVLRFYVDYPDQASGLPAFLVRQGVTTRAYTYFENGHHQASVAPDWNDPRLVQTLHDFIVALGQRYDGDPRIGFLTAGLVGFWGEGHTWPQDGWTEFGPDYPGADHGRDAEGVDRLTDWGMTEENKGRLLRTWADCFRVTPVQIRTPLGQRGDGGLGFHDDSFAWETLDEGLDPGTGQSWMFWATMRAAGATEAWMNHPMGGEVRPEIQLTMWSHDPPRYRGGEGDLATDGQDFWTCARVTHPTWLLMHEPFVADLPAATVARINDASSRLGYVLRATRLTVEGPSASEGLSVELAVENLGLAPFYASWTTELGLQSASGQWIRIWHPGWTWKGILPLASGGTEGVFRFRATDLQGLVPGPYRLALRTVNPLEGRVPHPLPLLLANREQGEDGWLTLASLRIPR